MDREIDDDAIEVYVPAQGNSTGVVNVSETLTHRGSREEIESNVISSTDFPYSLVLKVQSSEPRDVLQSERTCLTFIRFSTALFFTSLAILLNFKFDTLEKSNGESDPQSQSTYSIVVSYILIFLSLSVLIVSGFNYFITVNRYAKSKISTYNFNNLSTVICMTGIVVTLVCLNILMIVEGYLKES